MRIGASVARQEHAVEPAFGEVNTSFGEEACPFGEEACPFDATYGHLHAQHGSAPRGRAAAGSVGPIVSTDARY